MLTLPPDVAELFTMAELRVVRRGLRLIAAIVPDIERLENCGNDCQQLMLYLAQKKRQLEWIEDQFFPESMRQQATLEEMNLSPEFSESALAGVLTTADIDELGEGERLLQSMCPTIDALRGAGFKCAELIEKHKQVTDGLQRIRKYLVSR